MRRLENRLNNLKEVSTLLSLQDVSVDIITSFLGKKIGAGTYRSVYEFNLNPTKQVIKIETNNTDSNISEFLLWNEIQGLCGDLEWVKNWFAPVHYLSPNGKVLIMARTEQKEGKKRPDKVPSFLFDVKDNNFGWIGNKFVCHDYGIIYGFLKYEKKFKNANF